MRDLHYYESFDIYRHYVHARFHDLFLKNHFYSSLIDMVCITRAPIFYRISDPSEHFAFSGAYHFETEREKYPNIFRRNLFWLHDFTHMLFPYPWDVYNVSEYEFIQDFIYQERIASTETEVFAYYRVPGLRERVFQDEKLYYDVMRERGYYGVKATSDQPLVIDGFSKIIGDNTKDATHKPDAAKFLYHRNLLVNNDAYGDAELGDYPEILVFFRKWRTLTPKWAAQRYRSMVGKRMPPTVTYRKPLNVGNYEREIESFNLGAMSADEQQSHYEQVTLENVQRAYAMLGWPDPPQKWSHVPEALHSLEGAVFFQ